MPKTATLRNRRAVKSVYQRPLTPVRMAEAPEAPEVPELLTPYWDDHPVDALFPGADPLSFMADEDTRDRFILSIGDLSFGEGVVCPDMMPGM